MTEQLQRIAEMAARYDFGEVIDDIADRYIWNGLIDDALAIEGTCGARPQGPVSAAVPTPKEAA